MFSIETQFPFLGVPLTESTGTEDRGNKTIGLDWDTWDGLQKLASTRRTKIVRLIRNWLQSAASEEALRQRIESTAEARGLTPDQAIQQAIEQWIAGPQEPETPATGFADLKVPVQHLPTMKAFLKLVREMNLTPGQIADALENDEDAKPQQKQRIR